MIQYYYWKNLPLFVFNVKVCKFYINLLLDQERGLAKHEKPRETTELEVSKKMDSTLISSHQGEQESETYSEKPLGIDNCPEPVPFEISKGQIEYDNEDIKVDLKKILSAASQKELLVPTQKDMDIRDYINKYNEKNIANFSSIAHDETKGLS